MKVKDIMTRDVIRVDKDERLGTVLDLMRRHHLSKLPVVDADRFVGVVTDGDILDELGAQRNRGMAPNALHASAAVRKDVPTVSPDQDAAEVRELLKAHAVGMLPVTEDGKVVGVVTKADLLPLVKGSESLDRCMVKELYAVGPTDRVVHARRMMLDHNVERLPVLQGGRLIGIVGELEMALGYAKFKEHFATEHQDNRLRNFYVEDVMRRDIVTATPDMTVQQAAGLMVQEDVGSLPVVGPNDRIEGMVTRTDLLPFVQL